MKVARLPVSHRRGATPATRSALDVGAGLPSFLRLVGGGADVDTFAVSVARGLATHPRSLSCRYLYDERGSELFDAITRLPEYYLTRAEDALLRTHAPEIRELAGATALVELGSGTSTKTRHLLDAWTARDPRSTYVPVDICAEVVEASCTTLRAAYPELDVRGIAGSYDQAMPWLARVSPLTVAFLGSTVGNFDDAELDDFLDRLAGRLRPGDCLLLGVDLVKDIAVLEPAYDDAAGVTAEFTRNLFARMNRELDADLAAYDPSKFFTSTEMVDTVPRLDRVFTEDRLELLAEGIAVTELPADIGPWPTNLTGFYGATRSDATMGVAVGGGATAAAIAPIIPPAPGP